MSDAASSSTAIPVQEEWRRQMPKRPRLVSVMMLTMLGCAWGLVVPLSSLAMAGRPDPLGLSTSVSGIGAVIFLCVSASRGTLCRLTRRQIGYFGAWASVSTLGQCLLFLAASYVPASTISVIVILDGLIVFMLSTLLRLEAASPRRLAGLAIAFAGLAFMLGLAAPGPPKASLMTVLAVGVPLCYALENLLISSRWPKGVDAVAGLGIMHALAAMIGGALVLLFECRLPFSDAGGGALLLILLIGICAATANWLFQALVKRAGSVFASQSSYVVTIAGIFWSVILLGETLPIGLWIGVAAVLLGIFFVQPAMTPARDPSLHNVD